MLPLMGKDATTILGVVPLFPVVVDSTPVKVKIDSIRNLRKNTKSNGRRGW